VENDNKNVHKQDASNNHKYHEETAAEIATPYHVRNEDVEQKEGIGAKGMGYTALAFAILSLFFAPFVMGTIGIVLGFIAIRKGASSLGSWSIGISAFSMIIGLFILPFF
jgi:hypothetical protein